MKKNEDDSGSRRLSENFDDIVEERKRHLQQKYGENVPYWEISLAELEEMDQEQQEALLEKSLRDYPEEGKQFLSDQADLRDMAREAALATSEWPAFPKERLYENPFAEGAREAWEFYRRIMKEDEVKGWNLLKDMNSGTASRSKRQKRSGRRRLSVSCAVAFTWRKSSTLLSAVFFAASPAGI